MKSLWSDQEASAYKNDLELRVYTSRLLGQNPALVLHGGGNTSVKITEKNIFEEEEEILYVKGSGWDLATIEKEGFSPVRMDALCKLAELPSLSDSDMVKYQKQALIDPSAPNPSIEAILHAIIPFKYVDHTHADAVVTISNSKKGRDKLKEIYGDRVLIVPYMMPGFILASKIYEMIKNIDVSKYEAIILLNHGVFTYANDAKTSYNKMIEIVSKAEEYMYKNNAVICDEEIDKDELGFIDSIKSFFSNILKSSEECELAKPIAVTAQELAQVRALISQHKGQATIVSLDTSRKAVTFSNLPECEALSSGGVQTPEHILRLKKEPAILVSPQSLEEDFEKFIAKYEQYFEYHQSEGLASHNPAPNWAVFKGRGLLYFGKNQKDVSIIQDIATCNISAMMKAAKLGGYKSISIADMFNIEYWELELAKLKKASSKAFEGKIVLLTEANATLQKLFEQEGAVVDIYDNSVENTILKYGGLDILIDTTNDIGQKEKILDQALPFLKMGMEPNIVFGIGSNSDKSAASIISKSSHIELIKDLASELKEESIRVNGIIMEEGKSFDKLCIHMVGKDFTQVSGTII
jgi:rhamnose utilization protein RhaD (predicted bifunctional aldolase and dehydrogenase)